MNKKLKIKPTLFFIPDITGYSSYVNDLEIEHSTKIIIKLLEIIIESNSLNLEISEIEGDAILFYRFGPEPKFEDLLDQVKLMHFKFHEYLIEFDNNRNCNCSACSNAKNLNIKFISHYGKATKGKVKKFEKFFGSDVTLAHRLLKNNILDNEYLLWSSPSITTRGRLPLSLKSGESYYDHIGKVNYMYLPLSMSIGSINIKNSLYKQ